VSKPLADSAAGVILQGVAAIEFESTVRSHDLAPGEAVLWRERRAPPFMEFFIAVAVVLAVGGAAVQSLLVTPLALAAAAAVVLLGRRFAAGHYLEDQVLTDRRVVVMPRVGSAYGLPLGDIESVELRGTRASFTGGGRELRFSFVRRHRALRKALETGAPHISFEQRWDPNCAG
jgi:hypothetical protein